MTEDLIASDDEFDSSADAEIRSCISLVEPKSFFLYAGAGSGKTHSLVEAVKPFVKEQVRQLTLRGQRVAIITYTNAARDEIDMRLEFDPRVQVSTIHSFAWSLIQGFNRDIRVWVDGNLRKQIAELEAAQGKGRPASKTAIARERSLSSKRRRLAKLAQVRRFVYSPTGINRGRDALNHAEVIAMSSEFLITKPVLARMLVSQYPVLLIDESQDTAERLMDALLDVQLKHAERFCLGLFGDTMQRIYTDGKADLDSSIPDTWAQPRKVMNHRCPARIIRLINAIRAEADNEQQRARSDKPEGHVRLFVVRTETPATPALEHEIRARMADVTGDASWKMDGEVKTLTLEHHMAAARWGFRDFFLPLYEIDHLRTPLLEGSLAGITFFTRTVLPLVEAMEAGDKHEAAAIVRQQSPLYDKEALENAGDSQVELLRKARDACRSLHALFANGERPSLAAILRNVAESELFTIPEALVPFAGADTSAVDDPNNDDDNGDELDAWRRSLETSFDQAEKYDRYVRHESPFDTHQGVKGLEFPRVMVIISDTEARGFMFKYEKLLGTAAKSKTDLDNEASGRETTVDRTRRLFYVTCSRAEESLAVVYYAPNPEEVKRAAIDRGWFDASEIEVVG